MFRRGGEGNFLPFKLRREKRDKASDRLDRAYQQFRPLQTGPEARNRHKRGIAGVKHLILGGFREPSAKTVLTADTGVCCNLATLSMA